VNAKKKEKDKKKKKINTNDRYAFVDNLRKQHMFTLEYNIPSIRHYILATN